MSDSIGEKVKRWRELCDDGRTWDVGRVALCEAADEVERLAGFEHAWLLANVRMARLKEALCAIAETCHVDVCYGLTGADCTCHVGIALKALTEAKP